MIRFLLYKKLLDFVRLPKCYYVHVYRELVNVLGCTTLTRVLLFWYFKEHVIVISPYSLCLEVLRIRKFALAFTRCRHNLHWFGGENTMFFILNLIFMVVHIQIQFCYFLINFECYDKSEENFTDPSIATKLLVEVD